MFHLVEEQDCARCRNGKAQRRIDPAIERRERLARETRTPRRQISGDTTRRKHCRHPKARQGHQHRCNGQADRAGNERNDHSSREDGSSRNETLPRRRHAITLVTDNQRVSAYEKRRLDHAGAVKRINEISDFQVMQRPGSSCFATSVRTLTTGSQATVALRRIVLVAFALFATGRRRIASAVGKRIATEPSFNPGT